MKKSFIKVFVCFVALTVLSSVSMSYADPQEKIERRLDRKEEVIDNILEDLDLSRRQMKRVTRLRVRQREAMEDVLVRIQRKKIRLRREIRKVYPRYRKIRRLKNRIALLKGEIYRIKVDGLLGMKGILTPEQFDYLLDELQEMKSKKFSKCKKAGKKGKKCIARGKRRYRKLMRV